MNINDGIMKNKKLNSIMKFIQTDFDMDKQESNRK